MIINNTADAVGSYLQITLLCLPKHTLSTCFPPTQSRHLLPTLSAMLHQLSTSGPPISAEFFPPTSLSGTALVSDTRTYDPFAGSQVGVSGVDEGGREAGSAISWAQVQGDRCRLFPSRDQQRSYSLLQSFCSLQAAAMWCRGSVSHLLITSVETAFVCTINILWSNVEEFLFNFNR